MNNTCERCGRENHNVNECMAIKDINGKIIVEDIESEYVNLVIKDKTILGRVFKTLRTFSKNVKKILEVPRI